MLVKFTFDSNRTKVTGTVPEHLRTFTTALLNHGSIDNN